MKVKELMKKPIVIEKDITLLDAAKAMTKYSINSLIVENSGDIIGIVTHHDLIKYFGENKKVFDVMTKKVFTLKDSDKIERAVEIVKEKGIGIFPVIDSRGKVVGVFDVKDLLKVWSNDDFLID